METDGYTTLKVGVAGENKSKKCWKVLTIAGIILGISAIVVSLSALTLVILQMQVSKNSHILHEREISDTTLPLKTQEEEMKQVNIHSLINIIYSCFSVQPMQCNCQQRIIDADMLYAYVFSRNQ